MNIYENLVKLTEGYDNFAYFCTFDRESRTVGNEELYLSGSTPQFLYYEEGSKRSDWTHFISRGLSVSSGKLPVFISYDFINYIFRDSKPLKSNWPAVAYMIPDEYLHSTIMRKPEKSDRNTVEFERDHEMEDTISDLKTRIRSGEVLQVVISKDFPVDFLDKQELLQRFVTGDSSLYVFYYKFGEFEIIGSSPENMVSMDNAKLTINPIAGTRPRGIDDNEDGELGLDLASDPKEQMEHRMLVDLARNDLGRISVPGTVQVVEDMKVQKFSTVQHLVSTVVSELKPDLTIVDVIESTFPAGTVSGAPKRRSISLINAFERTPRGAYSGCIGTMKDGSLELALLIRSVFGKSGKYNVRAGAGIVKDSDPEKECQEMLSKAMTVIGGLKSESLSD